jgi:tRNA(fMet)-specific endonuclease VapC
VNGYLLDTNAVHSWACQNVHLLAHVEAVGNALIETSVITLGETECGHRRTTTTNPAQRANCIQWIASQFPHPLQVTRHTAAIYGELKAELFKNYPPRTKTRFPDGCYDQASGAEIGVDENDLWIASQAIEHDLVLISSDRMKRIRTAAGLSLDVEDWQQP